MIQRRAFIVGAGVVAASSILPGVSGAAEGRRYFEKPVTLDCWWWEGSFSSMEIPMTLYARRDTKPRLGRVSGALGVRKREDGDGTNFWRLPLSDAIRAYAHVVWGSCKSYTKTTMVSRYFHTEKPAFQEGPASIVIGRYHLGPRGLTFRDEGGNGKLAFGIRFGDEDYVTAALPVSDVREVVKGLRG